MAFPSVLVIMLIPFISLKHTQSLIYILLFMIYILLIFFTSQWGQGDMCQYSLTISSDSGGLRRQ